MQVSGPSTAFFCLLVSSSLPCTCNAGMRFSRSWTIFRTTRVFHLLSAVPMRWSPGREKLPKRWVFAARSKSTSWRSSTPSAPAAHGHVPSTEVDMHAMFENTKSLLDAKSFTAGDTQAGYCGHRRHLLESASRSSGSRVAPVQVSHEDTWAGDVPHTRFGSGAGFVPAPSPRESAAQGIVECSYMGSPAHRCWHGFPTAAVG